MKRAILGGACAGAIAAACGSSDSHPGALGGENGTDGGLYSVPMESLPSGTTSYAVLVGGTVPVSPGTRVGYALTASAPKTYMFRWTGDDKVTGDGFRNFYGSVWTTGTFTSMTPGCVNQACPLETGDFVSSVVQLSNGQRIDWSTLASDGWDGFGFTTDTEPLQFDVYVDGARRPDLFLFSDAPGGQTTSPSASPFGVTSSP